MLHRRDRHGARRKQGTETYHRYIVTPLHAVIACAATTSSGAARPIRFVSKLNTKCMVGVGGYDYFLVVVVVRRVSLPDSFLAGVRLPGAIVILFPWSYVATAPCLREILVRVFLLLRWRERHHQITLLGNQVDWFELLLSILSVFGCFCVFQSVCVCVGLIALLPAVLTGASARCAFNRMVRLF